MLMLMGTLYLNSLQVVITISKSILRKDNLIYTIASNQMLAKSNSLSCKRYLSSHLVVMCVPFKGY